MPPKKKIKLVKHAKKAEREQYLHAERAIRKQNTESAKSKVMPPPRALLHRELTGQTPKRQLGHALKHSAYKRYKKANRKALIAEGLGMDRTAPHRFDGLVRKNNARSDDIDDLNQRLERDGVPHNYQEDEVKKTYDLKNMPKWLKKARSRNPTHDKRRAAQ